MHVGRGVEQDVARPLLVLHRARDRLLDLGPQAVLLKGGHGSGPASIETSEDVKLRSDAATLLAADRNERMSALAL